MVESAYSDIDADRDRLIEIVRERSFQYGTEITLASGRTSKFYFNLKPTMMHPHGAYLIARLFFHELRSSGVSHVGGLEMGAVPLAATLAGLSHALGRPLAGFFVRKQAKQHGTKSLIEGLAKGDSLAGKKVCVLEDVTTTGGSALKAAAMLKDEGALVDRVLTVVDRQEGAAENFARAGVVFHSLLSKADFPPAKAG